MVIPMILRPEVVRELVSDILLNQPDLLSLRVRPFGELGHSASGTEVFIELVAEVSHSALVTYHNSKIPVDKLETEA